MHVERGAQYTSCSHISSRVVECNHSLFAVWAKKKLSLQGGQEHRKPTRPKAEKQGKKSKPEKRFLDCTTTKGNR